MVCFIITLVFELQTSLSEGVKTGLDLVLLTLDLQNTDVMKIHTHTGAGRYIACDCHAHLVSKAGSVISGKSPSPAFKWSGI